MQKNRIKDLCPICKVDAHYPPTLFIHGDQDEDVPYGQSEMMHDKLKDKGIQTTLIKISGGIHEFDKNIGRDQAQEVFESIHTFIDKHL